MDTTVAAWLAAGNGDDGAFVDDAWLRLLRRPVEPGERERALAELRLGSSRSELLRRLVGSAEFDRVRLFDDALSWAAAERRKGTRPRGLRAPAGTDPLTIAAPWCLARVGNERRILLLGVRCAPFEATLRRLAVVEDGSGDGQAFELAICAGPVDLSAVADRLAPGARVLVAAPDDPDGSDAGLLVFEAERYAEGGEGWHAVAEGGLLVCAELRPDRIATRVRAALRRR